MNDRFKFRVWSIANKKYCHFSTMDISADGLLRVIRPLEQSEYIDDYENRYVIQQCTGLKDSSGRLIYEGDIVEVKYIGGQIPLFKNEYVNEPEAERFQIYWNENWCSWSGKNDNYRGRCEIHSLDISKFLINTSNKIYEIIGNIYENEELLKV